MVEFYQVRNFYDNCPKCDLWIEIIKKDKILPLSEYEMFISDKNELKKVDKPIEQIKKTINNDDKSKFEK